MVIPVKWRKQVLTTRCRRLLLQILAIGVIYCLFRLLSYRYQQGLSPKHGGKATNEENYASRLAPRSELDQPAREEQWVARQDDQGNAAVVNPFGDWVVVPNIGDPRAHVTIPSNAERREVHEMANTDLVQAARDKMREGLFYDTDNLNVVRNAPDPGEGMGEVYRRTDLVQARPAAEKQDDVLIQGHYAEPIRFTNEERGPIYVHENPQQIRPPNVEAGRVYQGQNVDPIRSADEERSWVYPSDNVNPVRFQPEGKGVVSVQSDNVNHPRSPTEKQMDYFLEYARRLARFAGEEMGVAPIQNNANPVNAAIKEKGLDYNMQYVKHPAMPMGAEQGVVPIQNSYANPVRPAANENGPDYFSDLAKTADRSPVKEDVIY